MSYLGARTDDILDEARAQQAAADAIRARQRASSEESRRNRTALAVAAGVIFVLWWRR